MILGKLCLETMRLEDITKLIQPILVRGPLSQDIEGIAYDSRQVRKNYLFVAVKGERVNGEDFIDDAIKRGAVAVVSEQDAWPKRSVAHIHVENARLALAEIASAYYGHPAERLEMFGITGTNGKTTTSFMIRAILETAGRHSGLIGTVRYEIGERVIPAGRTTPEAPDIQFMLDAMIKSGCESAVMEVSSHALDQKRVWGVPFDVGIFTNLSRDHLDYHGTMENYYNTKCQLFRSLGQLGKSATAVINIDDAWGMRLAITNGLSAEVLTYGEHPGADVQATDVELGPEGSRFRLVSRWGEYPMAVSMPGRHNVSNALAAIAATAVRGIPLPVIAEALRAMEQVPGRLQRFQGRNGVQVYVDYAHSDDALSRVLQTVREFTRGKLTVVFGCGGNRDASKRPLMGAAASQMADHVIITNDNPRQEDPLTIIRQIESGIRAGASYEVQPDREFAIAAAIARARPGDAVIIAGKGHENYQEFAHAVTPFDDGQVVRKYLL
ncbi:MAG TPA: UDP-N-acetylmuramoyl-L-alanyl-D-glutamate--2,6-diaminopimelate ligase [Kiritimatiellia bacterium]|nr:UDP-N-acetylmuramoyl-L-alanyl-D-glutamate--2,6-diaminopimelate ligase [Kiritimatiellia bacterium]HMO99012.1 UDP-N-acetylmuramoyl-L-alanyl-D-glutamate--2,6-diaminopimelate ligase [Kiritimatiellia bacterium]HMP95899.1 UDP-N-acetylmuramoyl-L-alanyl-D-glutamate--2,6-diaminopimelate ligase [Kiritimatiellia bacterium]